MANAAGQLGIPNVPRATSLLGIGGRSGKPNAQSLLGIGGRRGRSYVRIPTRGHVGKPIPQGWPHPGAPGAPGTPGAAPGLPGYLDSTYYGNVNQNEFNVNNKINALQLRDAIGSSNLQGTLGQLAYQQPRAELSLEQGANRGGGLYSSVYSQNLGNLNTGYADRASAAQSAYAGQLAQDASQIAGLQGGIPLFNDQQAAAAAQRASLQAQKNPASAETPTQRLAQSMAKGATGSKGAGKGLTKGQRGRLSVLPRGRGRNVPSWL